MVKHLLSVVAVSLLLFVFPNNSLATSWAYPFVVWDGYIYVVSEEYVTEIESVIGKVTKYSDMEQYSGNFSNVYKKGTKYYSIKDISTDEAIAIKDENGKYKKAVREAKYIYSERNVNSGSSVVFIVLFIFVVFSFYFVIKKY